MLLDILRPRRPPGGGGSLAPIEQLMDPGQARCCPRFVAWPPGDPARGFAVSAWNVNVSYGLDSGPLPHPGGRPGRGWPSGAGVSGGPESPARQSEGGIPPGRKKIASRPPLPFTGEGSATPDVQERAARPRGRDGAPIIPRAGAHFGPSPGTGRHSRWVGAACPPGWGPSRSRWLCGAAGPGLGAVFSCAAGRRRLLWVPLVAGLGPNRPPVFSIWEANVAQLAEQRFRKARVVSSILTVGST